MVDEGEGKFIFLVGVTKFGSMKYNFAMKNSEDILDFNGEDIKCRICWEEEGYKISPCKCSGTMRYVHETCLMEWI